MITVNTELCVGCGKCVKDCISRKLTLKDGKAYISNDCLSCGHCVAICPVSAVSIPEYDMRDVENYDENTFSLNPQSLLHSIKFRRSIRDYKHQPIEQEKLELLLQAGRYTATAKNNQDCCFIFVQKELDALKEIIWDNIDQLTRDNRSDLPTDLYPYFSFNQRRKADKSDDYLFRNAPSVIFITSDWPLDAGLAAQNMELMAVSLDLGILYNGFLCRIANQNARLKSWLGIEGKEIKACMLVGYPNITYQRTAPRKVAKAIWK